MAAAGISFNLSLALIWGPHSTLQQSPSALAIGQRGEQSAVRHEGQIILDHARSILMRLDEGPARPNVSTTIIRLPQFSPRADNGRSSEHGDISARPSGGTPRSSRLTVRRKGGGCVINARRLPLRLAEPAPPQSPEIPASARSHRARSRVRRGRRRRVGKRDKAWRGTARRAVRSCELSEIATSPNGWPRSKPSRASRRRFLSPIGYVPTQPQKQNSDCPAATNRDCARTIAPSILTSRQGGEREGCSASSRLDQPNGSCPFTRQCKTPSSNSKSRKF